MRLSKHVRVPWDGARKPKVIGLPISKTFALHAAQIRSREELL
jgi:hypothetical protein